MRGHALAQQLQVTQQPVVAELHALAGGGRAFGIADQRFDAVQLMGDAGELFAFQLVVGDIGPGRGGRGQDHGSQQGHPGAGEGGRLCAHIVLS